MKAYLKKTVTVLSALVLTSIAHAQDSNTTINNNNEPTNESTAKTSNDNPPSKGGLFVEPMLTAESVNSHIDTSQIPGFTDTTGKTDGAGAGLRLGGHVGSVVFLAADGRYHRDHIKDSGYGDANADAYNYGVTLGAQTPYWGLRVWGTDILGGESNPDAGTNNIKASFKGAHGYRVGAGFHIGSVALNVEYQDMAYGTTTLNSINTPLGTANIDRDTSIGMTEKGPIASLSFPIEL